MEQGSDRRGDLVGPAVLAALIALAALPTLAAALRFGADWIAVSDQAAIAMRARDVASPDTPLVGMPTSLSHALGEPVHHPGPMGFWPVAVVQAVVRHPAAPMVAAAGVNLVAIAGTVAYSARLGGRRAAAVVAAAIVLVTWSLRDDLIVDPWNPCAGLAPLGLTIAAVIAWQAGVRGAGPVAVVAGSLVVQSHLTLVLPVAAFIGAAVAVTWPLGLHRARATSRRERIGTLAVAGACWLLPLLDLIVGDQNLWRLARAGSGSGDALGVGGAWGLVARAVVTPPWRVDHLVGQEVAADSGWLMSAAGAAILLGVVGLAVSQRRRMPAVAALLSGSVAGLVAGGIAASRIPIGFFNLYALHNYFWTWTLSAGLWFGVLLAAGTLLRDRGGRWAPRARALGLGAVVALAGIVAASAVAGPSDRSSYVAQYGPATRGLADGLRDRLDDGSTYLVDVPDDIVGSMVPMGLAAELERQGVDVVVPDRLAPMVGERRVGGDPVAVLRVDVGLELDDARFDVVVAPSGPAVERRRAAVDAVMDEIVAHGSLVLAGSEGSVHRSPAEARTLVESGALLGWWNLGLVVEPQLTASVMHEYRMADEGPVREAGVRIEPLDAAP